MAVPALAASQVIQVSVSGQVDAQQVLNVFHYRLAVIGGGDTLNDFETGFTSNWLANVMPQLSIGYKLFRIRMIQITGRTSNAIGAKLEYGGYAESLAAGTPGTVSGDYLPSTNTMTVAKVNGRVGKLNRGYTRFGPVARSQAVAELLTAGTITAIETSANSLVTLSFGAGSDAQLVLFHKTLFIGTKTVAPDPTSVDPVFYTRDVDNFQAVPWTGTQRTRKLTERYGA